MFGKNEIVGKKYFKEVPKDSLYVTSYFSTLQGEGPMRGEPAFFIRLAKCNLNCSFCDTFFDGGDWYTFSQLEEKIEESLNKFYADKGMARPLWTKHDLLTNTKKRMVLVITGGEPTLQENLGAFLQSMNNVFAKTQIESNGTQDTWIPNETTYVCSPKCSEKNGVAVKYLQPRKEVLKRADCLKFVMSADPNSPYSEVPDWAHDWARETGKPVFISPMNVYNDVPQKSKELRAEKTDISIEERSTVDEVISFWTPGLLNMVENQKNHEYAAEYCMRYGFTFQVQIHLLASLA